MTAKWMIRRILCRCFMLLAVITAAEGMAAAALEDCSGIDTNKGPVDGVKDEKSGVCSFLGVPYAAPPVGELRFELPAPHEPWAKPLAADTVGSQCPQEAGPMTDPDIPMDEDCLYLNVWSPEGSGGEKKPVMVFIHGGGFIVGSGGNAGYNGEVLAHRGDVVVVTMNYRLGVLGFMAHPAFSNEDGPIVNRGMYDQLAALEWVRDNISGFGGDPDNVTLFGQSAGGMSVGYHLVSPLSAGLFRNAAIHSGPPVLLNVTTEWAVEEGLKIAEKVGCGDPDTAAECLRAIAPEKFIESVPAGVFIMDDVSPDRKYFFQPVIDGKFLPDAPYKLLRDGKFNTDVHLMLGTTKDEASYFTLNKTLDTPEDFTKNYEADTAGVEYIFGLDLDDKAVDLRKFYPVSDYPGVSKAYQDFLCDVGFTCPIEVVAMLVSKYQPEVYRFYHRKAPFKIVSWGAFHGAELPYVFNYFTFMNQNFRSGDNMALSKKAIALWSAFAHTGSPQVKGLPEWPKYDAEKRQYLVLDDEIEVGEGLKKEKCDAVGEVLDANFE